MGKQDEVITEEAIEIELRRLIDIIPERTVIDVIKIRCRGARVICF